MDDLVETRERGYVCAAPVHALMVAQRRPRDAAALRGRHAGRARRHAARLGGEPARRAPRGPRLRPRADAPLQRPLRRARPPRLALRRARPGLARAARAQPAPPPPRHQDRRRLLAALPRARRATRRRPSSSRSTRRKPDVLWVGIGVPKQEKWMARMRDRLDVPVMCGVGAAFDFHAGRDLDGAALDAGARPRVDLPHRAGAAPAAAALPLVQPALRGRVRTPVPGGAPAAARRRLPAMSDERRRRRPRAGWACRSRSRSPTAAAR